MQPISNLSRSGDENDYQSDGEVPREERVEKKDRWIKRKKGAEKTDDAVND
jgi:hypothetical protein